MEKQREKKMDNSMETAMVYGSLGIYPNIII